MKLTIDDIQIGEKYLITKKPKMWSSLLNKNNPLSSNLKYPYEITIRNKNTEDNFCTIACDNYGWNLCYLIDQEIIKKVSIKRNKRFPFTLHKRDAQQIIDIACDNWKKKLSNKWSNILFEDYVLVDEIFYKEMRKACTNVQNVLFDNIFGKDTPEINFNILNDEDVFIIKTDSGMYLFKGSDPFNTKVLSYHCLDNFKFENIICSKEDVIELTKATEEEEQFYYTQYPKFKKGDWVKWSGINPVVSQIKKEGISNNCWGLVTPGHNNCHEKYLRLATPEEIKEVNKPIPGELYFVRDSESDEWKLKYAAKNNKFYTDQNCSGTTADWNHWVKAVGIHLPK